MADGERSPYVRSLTFAEREAAKAVAKRRPVGLCGDERIERTTFACRKQIGAMDAMEPTLGNPPVIAAAQRALRSLVVVRRATTRPRMPGCCSAKPARRFLSLMVDMSAPKAY